MKMVTSAKPRQKSTALGCRHMFEPGRRSRRSRGTVPGARAGGQGIMPHNPVAKRAITTMIKTCMVPCIATTRT